MSVAERLSAESHHPAMQGFSRAGGDLLVAGRSVADWVEQAGSTPVYLYDAAQVQHQIEQLRAVLPDGIAISYAIKANPYEPLVRRIAGWVDGFDVASERELQLALAVGMPASSISFAGPGKSLSALTLAIQQGVVINVESATELDRCASLAETLGAPARICLRVNPQVDVTASGMKMSSAQGSPFGIDADQIPGILSSIPLDKIDLQGLHVYGCSQQLHADSLLLYLDAVLGQLEKICTQFPVPLRQVNLGGGFGIPYFPNDRPLDIARVGEGLSHLLNTHREWLDGVGLKMEFGRFLTGLAGLYVCQVVDIKRSGGQSYAIVDGGMHHHLANAGLLGQVVRRNYPLAVANKMNLDVAGPVNISGPLCTPLDRLAVGVDLPKLEIGDLIAVFSSGAYGLTASPTAFLGQPAARELVCD